MRFRGWIVAPLGLGAWLASGDAAWAQAGATKGLSEQLSKIKLSVSVLDLVLSNLALAAIAIVFLIWVRSTDWVNRSRRELKIGRGWNAAMFFPFMVFMLGASPFILIPITLFRALTIPPLLLAWAIPFFLYVSAHNHKVSSSDDKVFTKRHLKRWFAGKMSPLGVKIDVSEPSPDELGPPVKLTAQGGTTDRDLAVALMTAKQSPGFMLSRELLAIALERRSQAVMLDFTATACATRLQIDGIWHQPDARDRESSDAILAVMKTIACLNPADRRNRQRGTFGVEFKGTKLTALFNSSGTQTGERALVQFNDGTAGKKRVPDLGMRNRLFEELKPVLELKGGVIVLSAPPSGGLSTLLMATVGSMDRYLRSFVAVEDELTKEMVVENVPVKTFNTALGETPATILPKLRLEYPDVYVVPDIRDTPTAETLLDYADEYGVVTTVRAKEASEALLRLLALKIPIDQYLARLKVVINTRLLRKLCEQCREAYPPTPQMLQRMGIPPGKVQAFYRPPTPNPEQPREPCGQCGGLGYFGQTGMFEVLILTDEIRQAIQANPRVDAVRAVARKAGMRTLQEEGIVFVAQGVTSLEELSRALKE